MNNYEKHYVFKIWDKKDNNVYDIISSKTSYISKIRHNTLKSTKNKDSTKYKIFNTNYDYLLLETVNNLSKNELHNRVVFFYEQHKTKELMGAIAERDSYHIIKNIFATGQLCKSKYKYSHFDFYDELFLYELKSRTIHSNKYNTAIINTSKLIDRNLIIIFQYLDGYFYIRYDKNVFDTFERNYQVNNQEVINIPIQYLTRFNNDDKIILPRLYNERKDTSNKERLINEDNINYENTNIKKLLL